MKNSLLNKENIKTIIVPLIKKLVRGSGILSWILIKLFDFAWFLAIKPFLAKHKAIYEARVKQRTALKMLEKVSESTTPVDLLKAVKNMNKERKGLKPDEID